MHITPYLIFAGQCEAAFRFYADLLGAEIPFMQTYGDSPAASEVNPGWHDRIIHAFLQRGDMQLMASDAMSGDAPRAGNVHVSLDVEDPDEAERIFAALSDGGEVTMAMEETFWARRFGIVTDRFGIPWMVNCSRET